MMLGASQCESLLAQPGPGAQHFARMARAAYRRARAHAGDDIDTLALDLGYELEGQFCIENGFVVVLDERLIMYKWAPQQLLHRLYVAVGIAMAELGFEIAELGAEADGTPCGRPGVDLLGDAVGYAGYLMGLHDERLDPYELAPIWFVPLHEAYRRKVGTGAHDSGQRASVTYLAHLHRR